MKQHILLLTVLYSPLCAMNGGNTPGYFCTFAPNERYAPASPVCAIQYQADQQNGIIVSVPVGSLTTCQPGHYQVYENGACVQINDINEQHQANLNECLQNTAQLIAQSKQQLQTNAILLQNHTLPGVFAIDANKSMIPLKQGFYQVNNDGTYQAAQQKCNNWVESLCTVVHNIVKNNPFLDYAAWFSVLCATGVFINNLQPPFLSPMACNSLAFGAGATLVGKYSTVDKEKYVSSYLTAAGLGAFLGILGIISAQNQA